MRSPCLGGIGRTSARYNLLYVSLLSCGYTWWILWRNPIIYSHLPTVRLIVSYGPYIIYPMYSNGSSSLLIIFLKRGLKRISFNQLINLITLKLLIHKPLHNNHFTRFLNDCIRITLQLPTWILFNWCIISTFLSNPTNLCLEMFQININRPFPY